MTSLSNPPATSLAGTEFIRVEQAGRPSTLLLSQFKGYANSTGLGSPATNPPTNWPAISALDGTEQLRLFQAGGWKLATVAQVATWAVSGTVPAFALHASGKGLGGLPLVAALDGTEQLMIRQGAGETVLSLAQLRTWLTS